MPPIMINDRIRIGFVAKKEIKRGEELFFSYGVKDKTLPWLKTDARAAGTTLQKIKPKERPAQECTVEGCCAVVKKLADHLRVTHKMSKKMLDKHLAIARKVHNYTDVVM